MRQIGSYLVSICAAAILCSILKQITTKLNMSGKWIQMLAGLLMAIVIISPLKQITFAFVQDFSSDYLEEGRYYAQRGEQIAAEQTAQFITEHVRTYILEKASSMNAKIEVEVLLSDSKLPTPCGVQIQGEIAPYTKQVLTAYISDELGVPEEKQVWIQAN